MQNRLLPHSPPILSQVTKQIIFWPLSRNQSKRTCHQKTSISLSDRRSKTNLPNPLGNATLRCHRHLVQLVLERTHPRERDRGAKQIAMREAILLKVVHQTVVPKGYVRRHATISSPKTHFFSSANSRRRRKIPSSNTSSTALKITLVNISSSFATLPSYGSVQTFKRKSFLTSAIDPLL